MTIDARLGYRNKEDPDDAWKMYASSEFERNLECSISTVSIFYLLLKFKKLERIKKTNKINSI